MSLILTNKSIWLDDGWRLSLKLCHMEPCWTRFWMPPYYASIYFRTSLSVVCLYVIGSYNFHIWTLVRPLAGWSVGWLICWSVSWSVGCLVCLSYFPKGRKVTLSMILPEQKKCVSGPMDPKLLLSILACDDLKRGKNVCKSLGASVSEWGRLRVTVEMLRK